jgi:uncharacterized membrane protein
VVGFLRSQLLELRSAFWTLPSLITAVMVALAVLLIEIDRRSGPDGTDWAFSGDAEAARGILSTIAGSLITVAGLSFSITIVTLQLVSQQFTPRALRNFLGDRLNQSVAGVFVGVFLYSLVVLTAVEEGEEPFVPGVSLLVAFLLALAALAMLFVFINHMAHSIQVSSITSRIARLTLRAAEELYPAGYGEAGDEEPEEVLRRWRGERQPQLVHPDRPGFVQSVGDLAGTIGGSGFRIALHVGPGDFVTENDPLASVWPPTDGCEQAVRRAVAVASARDVEQDVAYGLRQLTDIAVRALSPSVNDPTTAATCIGYVQAILERLAATALPAEVRRFPERDATLILPRKDEQAYLEALVQISRYAEDARVLDALLRATGRVRDAAVASGQLRWAAAAETTAGRIHGRVLANERLDPQERAALDALAERSGAG